MIDELGHGTHVLGIAAGNGKDASGAQTDFGGVAPEATIVYVSLNYKDPEGSAFVDGTSVTVIDAIKFISDQAKSLNMPWVANLSSGALYGPRNGTSLYERAIAEIANDNSFGEGRILVTSAGNGHQNLSHEYYNAGKNNHENVTYNAMLNFHIQPDDPTVINSATIEVYIPTGVTVDEFFL
ncbi:MAG: S8 family serine peptidase [Cytophagales bacterium]|nr:S8 family serine peptidase [Cytophagales bacterium]